MSTTLDPKNLTLLSVEINQDVYLIPENFEIFPYASYVAIACVLLFALFIIIARLVIRVDGQQSDLILFNKSPQKHLLLLVSKQLYNTTAAQNNIASAIANGLMEPPPGYDPSKMPQASANAIKNISMTNIAMHDISAKTSTTTLNSLSNNINNNGSKFDAGLDSIETTKPNGGGRRQKW